jgi:hypothetical protein
MNELIYTLEYLLSARIVIRYNVLYYGMTKHRGSNFTSNQTKYYARIRKNAQIYR